MTGKTYTSGDDGSLGYGVGGQRTDDGMSEVAGPVTAKADNLETGIRDAAARLSSSISQMAQDAGDWHPDAFNGIKLDILRLLDSALQQGQHSVVERLDVAVGNIQSAQRNGNNAVDLKAAVSNLMRAMRLLEKKSTKQLGPRASDEYDEGEIIKVPGAASAEVKALNSIQQSVARAAWLGDYDQTMRLLPQLSYADTQGLLRYANEQLQGGRDLVYKERAGLRRIMLWVTEYARSKKKSVKASSSEQVRKYLNDQGFDVGAREFEVHGEGDYTLSVIRTGGGAELAKRDMERAQAAISRYPGARIHSADVMPSSHRPDSGWSAVIGFTVRGAKKKSKAADLDASVHLLTLSQATDARLLAAVNRALADLRGTVLTEDDRKTLADFARRAREAKTDADWNKLKREAGRMLTAYMVRGSVKTAVKQDAADLLAARGALDGMIIRLSHYEQSYKPHNPLFVKNGFKEVAASLRRVVGRHPELRGDLPPILQNMRISWATVYQGNSVQAIPPLQSAREQIANMVHKVLAKKRNKSTKSVKLLPGARVLVKSQNSFAVIKEVNDKIAHATVAFVDADGREIPGSMAVAPFEDLQVRSKKAYKRVKARTKEIRRSAWNVALPKNKIEQVVNNPDVLIDESLAKELLGLIQLALTYEELEKPHLRALQKMQSALGSVGQMAKQMKKDLKQRDERSPQGEEARVRLKKTQDNIRNVLKGAVTTANEALQATMGERVRGRPGAEDFDRQRQRPGLLRRAFGRRSAKDFMNLQERQDALRALGRLSRMAAAIASDEYFEKMSIGEFKRKYQEPMWNAFRMEVLPHLRILPINGMFNNDLIDAMRSRPDPAWPDRVQDAVLKVVRELRGKQPRQ